MKYAFTGSRNGINQKQIKKLLAAKRPISCAHGDCVGADAQFHELITDMYQDTVPIVIHPPKNKWFRAFCKSKYMMEPLEYLKRNQNIVDSCDVLIACPETEQELLRSGTWATIRYARKMGKPIYMFPYFPRIAKEEEPRQKL